jgi:hypothetical protein
MSGIILESIICPTINSMIAATKVLVANPAHAQLDQTNTNAQAGGGGKRQLRKNVVYT